MPPIVNIDPVTHRLIARRLAQLALVVLLMAAVAVTGCSNGYRDAPQARAARVGTTSDMNPRDPATLRDGGNLRLPLVSFPDNFNELNIDGNTSDNGSIVTPTLARSTARSSRSRTKRSIRNSTSWFC